MVEIKNPCLSCDSLEYNENNDECSDCILRTDYIKCIDCSPDVILDRIADNIRAPQIDKKEDAIIISLLKRIKLPQCKNEDCIKTKIFAMGLCKTCYLKNLAKRKSDGGYNASLAHISNRGCSAPGCDKKHHGKGYCEKHYKQKKRISLQIDRDLFNAISNLILPDYPQPISNNKIIEVILEQFIASAKI